MDYRNLQTEGLTHFSLLPFLCPFMLLPFLSIISSLPFFSISPFLSFPLPPSHLSSPPSSYFSFLSLLFTFFTLILTFLIVPLLSFLLFSFTSSSPFFLPHCHCLTPYLPLHPCHPLLPSLSLSFLCGFPLTLLSLFCLPPLHPYPLPVHPSPLYHP